MSSALPVPSLGVVIALGFTTLTILVVQMLIGYRKIKFKGRTHLRVHRAVAWGMLALALVHMTAAMLYTGFWPF